MLPAFCCPRFQHDPTGPPQTSEHFDLMVEGAVRGHGHILSLAPHRLCSGGDPPQQSELLVRQCAAWGGQLGK